MTWPVVRLEEIAASVDYGFTASSTLEPIGPKFLRITDIQDGSVDWDRVPYCSASVKEEAENQLSPGDIVFARTGATTGKSFLIKKCPDRTVFASYLIRVRPNKKINPSFLAHFFDTPGYWSQITQSARGAAQIGINSTVLRQMKIPLPPLEYQLKASMVLDFSHEIREIKKRIIKKLNNLPIRLISKLQEEVIRGGFCKITPFSDILISPLRNGVSPSSGGTIKSSILTLSAITGDQFDGNSVKDGLFDANPPDAKRVSSKDLLICRGNGNINLVGKGYFPRHDMLDVVFPDTAIAASIDEKKCNKLYLECLWNSKYIRRQIEEKCRTTNGTFKINQESIESIGLFLPDLESQRAFAARVAEIDALKALHRAHLAKLDELFASLQHRAFRGEL